MREIPECLNRRYKALDELIKELSTAMNQGGPLEQQPSNENNNMGIKLMCDFWNILKDDPDCNLKDEVRQCMGVEARQSSAVFGSHRIDCCYMTNKEDKQDKSGEDRRREPMNRIKHICCDKDPKSAKRVCGGTRPTSKTSSVASDKLPLSKVLCNLKEAASFDKKCNARVGELMAAQKELTEQIQTLEQREKEGVKLLKQADCMWSCMEDTYKKKVAESLERQKILLKELKEVETSSNKWRKNKKDIEFQLSSLSKTKEDITEKINQKTNDIKVMDIEIIDLKKRIESNVEDSDIAKNSLRQKRDASDVKMANIITEMAKLQKKVQEQQRIKTEKVEEGTKYVKDARDDLQKICRVLLQKKLENEDLQAEKEALLQETDLLKNTCDTCKEKCKTREVCLAEQLKKLDDEIADHKNKCIRCHECTDTVDVRKFCTDCPRCLAERDCLYEGDHCSPDHTMDCVCMSVKQKFLDNVFDNMYTVLERQSKTSPGKAVADAVLNCLKRSRNGKLNEETRKILQDFILTTVKKNLNLTIVGGAVKTRCEMDPDTYKQLMLCLKEVNISRPTKEDKGTGAKKEACRRWGGPSECNCPKGPKACICAKKAPPPPHDPTPCGPPDKEDAGEVKSCPYKKNASCGPDCGMQGAAGAVGAEVAAWRPEPCRGASCAFSSNMRAAQCVLGPEPLAAVPKSHPAPQVIPESIDFEKMTTCSCGDKMTKPCSCRDRRSQPRQRIIEEVMGRYTEVSPIEKVTSEHEFDESNTTRRLNTGCDCSNLPMKYLLASNISENKISRFCACSSNYVPKEGRKPFVEKLRKKGHINICRSSKSDNDTNVNESNKKLSAVGLEMSQILNISRNKSDNDIKVILCPKFPHTTCDDKIELSLGTSKLCTAESALVRSKYESSLKSEQGFNSCDASFVEQKVCETVKELVKDIVVPDGPLEKNLSSSDVEWVTLSSLFKEITSLTKLQGLSSDTVNEVEVKCETLESSKDFRLLGVNMHEVQSAFYKNNIIEIQHDNQEELSYDIHMNSQICKSIYTYEREPNQPNTAAEELKSKLLDDIRQTYNISVETSLENVIIKEPDLNLKKLKNIRKCLRNLGETALEQTECNCIIAKRRKNDDYNNFHLKKTKKYFHYQRSEDKQSNSCEIDELRKCLLAISHMGKEELQQNENKVKYIDRNHCYPKHSKVKNWDKKNK